MARLVFKEGTILFAGTYPEDVEAAKAYARKYGFTKEDIKIYTEKNTYKPMTGGDPVEWKSVLIKTLRPIGMECGVIECPNHDDTGKES